MTQALFLCICYPTRRYKSNKEFFAESNAFIKENWQAFEDRSEHGFGPSLEWCIDVVSGSEGISTSD
jgi:hypothetical protein